jgi:SHS2 domain-containing protein
MEFIFMRKFDLLSHTADIRILAQGDSLPELFSASLEGLCEVLNPGWAELNLNCNLNVKIKTVSIDSTILLIDFLGEALLKMNNNSALLPKVKFNKINDNSLEAVLSGFKIDGFENDVKAVTYHEADIKLNENNLFETYIVLDI